MLCPIGFSVDFYLTSEELMALPAEQRAMTLMTAAVIEENDLEKASDAVSKLNPDSLDFSSGPEALFRELRRMQSPIFREILPGSPAEPTGWKTVWYILQFRIVRDGMLRLMENLQRSLIPEV